MDQNDDELAICALNLPRDPQHWCVGCLARVGLYGTAKTPKAIRVRYLDGEE